MHTLPSLKGHHLSPHELSVIRRVFEATCLKTRSPACGIQADRLARFIMDEFRFGNTDEASLLECACGTRRDVFRQSEEPFYR